MPKLPMLLIHYLTQHLAGKIESETTKSMNKTTKTHLTFLKSSPELVQMI